MQLPVQLLFFVLRARLARRGMFKVMKNDHFLVFLAVGFSHLGPFPPSYWAGEQWLLLEIHEAMRVLHAIACTMDFNLLCDLGHRLGELKMLMLQIFILFWPFTLTFRVSQGFICSKYDCLGAELSFLYLVWCYYAFICPANFSNLEIQRIPNTKIESRIPNT